MKGPKMSTLSAVYAEVVRARTKFPRNRHLLAALTEELGELAQAILQGKPKTEIEKEACQVACVAIRILEEGDSDFDGDDEAAWQLQSSKEVAPSGAAQREAEPVKLTNPPDSALAPPSEVDLPAGWPAGEQRRCTCPRGVFGWLPSLTCRQHAEYASELAAQQRTAPAEEAPGGEQKCRRCGIPLCENAMGKDCQTHGCVFDDQCVNLSPTLKLACHLKAGHSGPHESINHDWPAEAAPATEISEELRLLRREKAQLIETLDNLRVAAAEVLDEDDAAMDDARVLLDALRAGRGEVK